MKLPPWLPRSNVSIDEFRHLSCNAPARCSCDCDTCRQAWVRAGRPEIRPFPPAHIALEDQSDGARPLSTARVFA